MNDQSPVKQTTSEFLANEVYLPGYMLIRSADYDKKGGTFKFQVKEPPVARESIVHYFTPRGLHICISQAGYSLVENMVNEGLLEGFEIPILRSTLLEGRVKITELYEKFRREVSLSEEIQGRFDVRRVRPGRMPILQLDFSFVNNAINGYTTSVVAPRPMPQMNGDLIRISQ